MKRLLLRQPRRIHGRAANVGSGASLTSPRSCSWRSLAASGILKALAARLVDCLGRCETSRALTMNWIVGVDVGGTFTDSCAGEDVTGDVRLWKRSSTPENPATAIVSGLRELAATPGLPLREVSRLAHATTVATNALVQRKGCSVALVTTRGFRDLVEIGRQTRPDVCDLQRDYPDPFVPRRRRLEVTEGIMQD
jgi:hypothetical protein